MFIYFKVRFTVNYNLYVFNPLKSSKGVLKMFEDPFRLSEEQLV